MNLALKYGINVDPKKDTLESVQNRIIRSGGTLAMGRKGEGKGAKGKGAEALDEDVINIYAQQLKDETITLSKRLSNIPKEYRTAAIKKAFGTAGKKYELKSRISFIRKKQLERNGIDTAKLNEVEEYLNQGYSIEELIEANANILTSRQKELLRKIVREVREIS